MKTPISKYISPVFIGLLIFFMSCTGADNKCGQVDCHNGECVDGKCVCAEGFEGTNCETTFSTKFIGTFTCKETCTPTGLAGPYQIRIEPSAGSASRISIVGIWEVPATEIIGEIGPDGKSFTIDRQDLMKDYMVEAKSVTENPSGLTLTVSYKIIARADGEIMDECLATLVKNVEPAKF